MKNKTRVLMLRTNKVDPDPRVEKEVNTLIRNEKLSIEVLAWDRTDNYVYKKEHLELDNGNAVIHRIGIKAGWGVGIKKNAIAFVKYTFRTFVWLVKNCKSYDIIHACDLQTVIPALIPIILFKKKLVYDIYDYFSDTAHGNGLVLKMANKFETAVINRATATIICSERREEQIKPAKPKKMAIIHNAPSVNQIKASDKNICLTRTECIKLVYVGNLVEDRCIRELIEVVKQYPSIELHIGGMGDLTEFVQETSNEISNLYFYGKMAYDDVLALEKECDIMVAFYDQEVPNHKYAAPNKFYEAIALGKPLVMFHNTGVDDIIDKYDLGITVEQSVTSMIKGISELIARQDEWKCMGERAKYIFKELYSWEIMEYRLNQLYEGIIDC